MKTEKTCWMCRRTALEVKQDMKDDDLDAKFALTKQGNVTVCLGCEMAMTCVLDDYLKNKFSGRGD